MTIQRMGMIFVCAILGCAHSKSAPTEPEPVVASMDPMRKTDPTFLKSAETGASCRGDGDCAVGELCHPGRDRCITSYPNPRMLDVSFTSASSGPSDCKLVNLYFPYKSTELVPEAQRWLEYNLRCIKAREAREVTIEGHADARGSDGYNKDLSTERSVAVKQFLSQSGLNIPVKVLGVGEKEPLRPGKNEKDYAYNRRVEFSMR